MKLILHYFGFEKLEHKEDETTHLYLFTPNQAQLLNCLSLSKKKDKELTPKEKFNLLANHHNFKFQHRFKEEYYTEKVIIKEVPVEIIKEVSVEVIKEVPVEVIVEKIIYIEKQPEPEQQQESQLQEQPEQPEKQPQEQPQEPTTTPEESQEEKEEHNEPEIVVKKVRKTRKLKEVL